MRFPLSQLIQLRREWVPYLILIISLLVTIGTVYYYINATATNDNLRFKNAVQRTRNNINDNFSTYLALLRGGVGLFAANESVTYQQFKVFVDRIQLDVYYPGIQGIGYSKKLSAYDLETLTEQMQQEGFNDFNLHPSNKRSEHNAIIYIEPLNARNKAALGYDMTSEPVRRAAMERARDTALPALSGKVTLIQEIDTKKQSGFLVYLPFYKGGVTPSTIAERRNLLEGYIYSPFRSEDLFSKIFGTENEPRVNFKIYDGKEASEKNLLYDSVKYRKMASYNPRFTKSEQLIFAGHPWTIIYLSTPGFDNGSEPSLVPFLLIAGFSGSFFLFYISRLQYLAMIKAEHSEQKLRLSEARYRRLVASTKVIPWEIDLHSGNITYVGPQAKHLLGLPLKDWYKKGFWQRHLHPDDKERATTMSMELAKSNHEYELDYRMVKKNGKVVWIHDIVTVIRKPNGQKMLTGILVDITDREMIAKQKDDFVSMATHELKTPVTSIKAYAQVLIKQFEKANDTKSAQYVAKMDAQLNKLISLIGDLLDVTKFESDRLQFHEEWFDSNELIQEIVEEVQRTTETHTIRMKLDETHLLYGDRDRIGQVLTNFLTNAIKYSPSTKKIYVKTKKEKKRFTCYVQDFGIGIPKESINKVFDRFFRVNGPHEDAFPGLGLGLYLSAEIIKRHNGKISVESIPKKGSTFYFSLPIQTKRSNLT